MGPRVMTCSVCGQKGHNSKIHDRDRCGVCGERGHKAPTCKRKLENVQDKTDNEVPPVPEGFSLRRDSTEALSKGEIHMATRVLLAGYKDRAEGLVKSNAIIVRACEATGLGYRKMLEINTAIKEGKVLGEKGEARGNWSRPECDRDILVKINDTIERIHARGEMTCVNKIRQNLDNFRGISMSKPMLTRLLHKMGYEYRAPKPNNILLAIESEPMRITRLNYLRAITAARSQGKEVVYLDESYVNDRHQAKMCWLQAGSKVLVPSGRGPRYILYGAGSRNGWVAKPTVFIHKDGQKDYHTGMNADHFEELFRETCQVAKEKLGGCIIVMDNAAYHRRMLDEKYRMSYWTKLPAADVKEAYQRGELPGQGPDAPKDLKYKKDIILYLRHHMPQGETRVQATARDFGHTVLMLPPYRPELNAIETAWAVGKNYVGRHNSAHMRFVDLKFIIETGLQEATVKTWVALDKDVIEEEKRQLEHQEKVQKTRDEFREEHAEFAFRLSDGESDSEAEDNTDVGGEAPVEVMAAISEGVDGSDEPLRDMIVNIDVVDDQTVATEVRHAQPHGMDVIVEVSEKPLCEKTDDSNSVDDQTIAAEALMMLYTATEQ